MTQRAGSRLGPYEIVGLLGSGGMGEVYRARDTRLDRDVAIKVLPAHLAESPERRERLAREARAISSLQHPNICALHDVGSENGVDFLVMELLEGETLAERLVRGPLPLREVFAIGIAVAGALDKAHRKGLVHRDLKPGNIMLTRTGPKVLDFGLAKRMPPGLEAEAPSATLTVEPLTGEATLFGTFRYMSPEQLEGRAADARSDLFSLGAILYEMATGRRAFDGANVASVIAAVLEDRFEVKVTMTNFANPPVQYPGVIQLYQGASSETDRSVSFYSFEDGSVEVLVKMVDACSTSNSFWLFAAGATNAETTVTVRDSHTGLTQTIFNPRGGCSCRPPTAKHS
jgi:serine/threonine protein kinase